MTTAPIDHPMQAGVVPLRSGNPHMTSRHHLEPNRFVSEGMRRPALPFGTKTVYAPHPSPPPTEPPLHVSLLARHGTRNPTKSSIIRMQSVIDHLAASGAPDDKLRPWREAVDSYLTNPGGLTSEGDNEMYAIGLRFRDRYGFAPGVTSCTTTQIPACFDLDGPSSDQDPMPLPLAPTPITPATILLHLNRQKCMSHACPAVRVRSSSKARALMSAEAFVRGYMAAEKPRPTPVSRDSSAKGTLYSSPSPVPPAQSCPTVSCSSSSDWDDGESSLLSCSTVSSASSSPSTSSDEGMVTDITTASATISVEVSVNVAVDRHKNVSEALGMSSLETDVSGPRVQVLAHGDDVSLRYFAHHSAYAAFARQHKVEQRSQMSAHRVRNPRSFGGNLLVRLASAFGVRPGCLTDEHVRIMAEAAGFDYAHGRKDSIFTQVLSDADICYLERYERRYRPFFKGHKKFHYVSAPLVADLMESLVSVVDSYKAGKPFVRADLRFAHAETLVPFLLLLNIQHTDIDPKNRRGLSTMSPFAGNLSIELYAPALGASPDAFRVRFRLHERYVTEVPALGVHGQTDDGFVEMGKLIQFFQNVLDAHRKLSFVAEE